MKEKIFVYGTLRKGMYNYDLYLKDKDSFTGYGYVKGTLMTLKGKDYPALLLTGDRLILGEIHEVESNFIKSLDKLENYFGENNPDNEYNKIVCDIYDAHQNIIAQMPVYVFNTSNMDRIQLLGEVIEFGDFVKYNQNI